MESGLTDTLAAHMAVAGDRPLPEAVEEAARIHILDTLAAVVSGASLLAGTRGSGISNLLGGEAESMVVGTGQLTGAVAAALANGMAAHADETDDSHAPSFSHPGCATVPAAVAAGERAGISGRRLVRAVTAGYDVGCRVGMALGPAAVDPRRSGPSSHSIVATFAAAAAAAVVDGLGQQQCAAALSYAAQQASGITTWQLDTEHVEKAFVFAGRPAAAGVLSAAVAREGWTGVQHVFDGHLNFVDALSAAPEPGQLTDGLGKRFEIARTNVKRYCVGSPAQAAVQAAEELLSAVSFKADDVESLEVSLPADLAGIVDGRDMPDINVQYLLAVTILDRGLTFAAAHDTERMQQRSVRRLIGVTRLVADEAATGTRSGCVAVWLRDGTEHRCEVSHVRGTAQNPMSWDEVAAKAIDLVAPRLGSNRATGLVETVQKIDALDDVRALRELLLPLP